MRKVLLRVLFILVPFLWSVYASSQPRNDKDCGTTCFSSQVVSSEKTSASCTSYELKVSFSGKCGHALSHYSVAVPCGRVESLWNSENWKQEFGTDPTTGLAGFKIDDISGFGEQGASSFTVKFTLCEDNATCTSTLSCWQPVVAYKASTCVNYETLTVNCKSLKASIQKQDASCFGATDGSLSVTIQEGREPFTYLWSNGATQNTLSNLAAGEYSVTVTDASGANIVLHENVSQPDAFSLTAGTSNATCNGVADGAIDLSVMGGTPPYTFSWNNGATTEDLHSLPTGTYAVVVTDSKLCQVSESLTITGTSSIRITSIVAKPGCNRSNGSIDVEVSGGAAPYSFEWSNGMTSEDIANISAGAYTLLVKDNMGCAHIETFLVKDDNTLTVRGTTSATGCTDDNSGSIDLTVTGGTAPYSFRWSNGMTDEDPVGLSSGFYTVTVTDASGCVISGGYAVSKTTFQVPRIVTQPMCFGEETGSIVLQEPIGGTGPFMYEWSTGETGTSLSGLAPGSYTVTVTDATGCTRTLTSTITAPSELVVEATVSSTACNAGGSFVIDLNVSGGSGPYEYEWSDGSTSDDLTNIDKGTYSVVITDSRGCTITKAVVVDGEAASWSCLIAEPVSSPACGSEDNLLTTPVTGADSYRWTVTSSDGSWSISSAESPSVAYRAGNANTSATFTLVITKDGCVQSCTYVASACIPQDNGEGADPGSEEPGEEEPGGEDPDQEQPGEENPGQENPDGEGPGGGSQTCEECFETLTYKIDSDADCHTYEMQVNTTGLCRHELSHWTLAVPCGSVSDYWNSEGWKMELGKDPTTGLFGLKVDNINNFGKIPATFTVRFTLCGTASCQLDNWDPLVAYKAGQCVGTESTPVRDETSTTLSVYPNPFNDVLNFEWKALPDQVSIDIIDQYGNTVLRSAGLADSQGTNLLFSLQSSALPKGMYYYRLTSGRKTYHGKLSKR